MQSAKVTSSTQYRQSAASAFAQGLFGGDVGKFVGLLVVGNSVGDVDGGFDGSEVVGDDVEGNGVGEFGGVVGKVLPQV